MVVTLLPLLVCFGLALLLVLCCGLNYSLCFGLFWVYCIGDVVYVFVACCLFDFTCVVAYVA